MWRGGSDAPVGLGWVVVSGWDVGVDDGTVPVGDVVGVTVVGAVVDVSDAASNCSNWFSRLFCARAVSMPVPHS
jgi:hypothetical protein